MTERTGDTAAARTEVLPLATRVRRKLGQLSARVPGYLTAARFARRDAVALVMYHGVTARPPAVPNWCLLAAQEFERQVDFLAAHYRVLPLDEVVDRQARGLPLPPRTACVTFDDGFRNVATTAFPILERRQMPSTVFLVTGLVGTGNPPWAERLYSTIAGTARAEVVYAGVAHRVDGPAARAAAYRALIESLKRLPIAERDTRLAAIRDALGEAEIPADPDVVPMDWSDVERLARTGLVLFGSHTRTHAILSRCSLEQQREELRDSRDVLRERGLAAHLFAYPNGNARDFTVDTKRLLAELGYRCALTTMPGLNPRGADLFELRRAAVGANTRGLAFEIAMAGL